MNLGRILETGSKPFVDVFQANGSHSHANGRPYFKPLHGDFGNDTIFEPVSFVFDKRNGLVAGKQNAIGSHQAGISERLAVRDRHAVRIDKSGSWQFGYASHGDVPRIVTGELYAKNILPEKRAALSFYRLNKIERAFSPKPMNEDSVRSVSIRERLYALPRAPIAKGVRSPGVLGAYSGAPSRAQLARSNASIFLSRIVCAFQHQPTDSADALPGINGLSVFSPVHGQHKTMECFSSGQNLFAKGANNV